MTKDEIRKTKIALMKELNTIEKEAEEHQLYTRLFESEYWKKADSIAMTMSQDFEINTQPIMEEAWKDHKKVLLPRAKKGRVMDFVLYTPETALEMSSFGILEPAAHLPAVEKEDIDLIIVPGLAYSQDGYRIGFGGGYYDRFLADYNGLKISLVLKIQQMDEWTPETFDIPLDALITKDRIIINQELREQNNE